MNGTRSPSGTEKGWLRVSSRRTRLIEVLPVDDLEEHVRDPGRCWCAPLITHVGHGWLMVSHNSKDGRELVEEHGLQ